MNILPVITGTIDPVAFNLFGWEVRWYGLIIGLGILVAYFLFSREAERKGIDSDTSFDLLFWGVIIGLIGARIYYVIFSLDEYIDQPLRMFFIWEGGMAIYGGVIAGTITIYYLCRKYRVNVLDVFDAASPALMAAQAIGRWGNFINQEAHGGPVSRNFLENLFLPEFIIEGMNINGTYYQPTFLYESVWNIVGLILILVFRRKPNFLKKGEITAFYLVWYGLGRFWIEGLRTDSLYIGPLRISQVVALLSVVIGVLAVVYIRRKEAPPMPYYTQETN